MPTLLRCPDCNALLRIHDAHLGKAVKCPKCERVILTRADGEPDAPPLPETRIETPTTVDNRRRSRSGSSQISLQQGGASDPALTARRSISIPIDLFRQMARETMIDWNKIAVDAFEKKLADLAKLAETAHLVDTERLPNSPRPTTPAKEAGEKSSDLTEVIQRLRTSKITMKRKGYPEGFAAGEEWARTKAEAGDLMALERFRDGMLDREWNTFFEFNNTIYTYAEALVMSIHPHIGDVAGARKFWIEAIGEDREDDLDNPVFLKAFAEGALQIWQSVKDAL